MNKRESLGAVHTHTHTHTHTIHLWKCMESSYAMVESVYSTESLNLSQLGFDKCTQNEQFSKAISYIEANKKDRLACGRYEERINLLHDSLSFL